MFQSIRDESMPEMVLFAHGVIVGLSTQFIADLPLCRQQIVEFVRGGEYEIQQQHA